MIEYFDINFWINSQKIKLNSKEEIKNIEGMLDKNSITGCIITNSVSLTYDWNTGNKELISLPQLMENRKMYFSFIIVPEAYFLLDFDDYIKSNLSKKMRMIRIFPKSHLFHLNNFYMRKIFKILSFYDIPVMMDFKELDITGNKYFAVEDLERTLRENKDLTFILECSLKQLMFSRFFYPLLEEYDNLYLEISGLFFMDQIEDMVKKFGSHRFVFGTGYPGLELGFSAGRIQLSDLKNQDIKNITNGNINRILDNIKL